MSSYDMIKLEDVLCGTFATFNPNTGANKDADSTPTMSVYEEGSSLSTDISVSNIGTGRYKWQVTLAAASGFEAGKFYDVWTTATVTGTDTVTQSAPLCSFKAVSREIDDIPNTSEFQERTVPSGDYSILSSGVVQAIVASGASTVQSTQASNAQIGASGALQAYDPPTRAELTTDKNEIIASGITQAGVRAAVGLASANLDTQLDAIPTVTEMNARTLPSGSYSTLASGDIVIATQQTIENNYLQYLFASGYNPASKPGASSGVINSLMDSSIRRFSATALELAPVGSGGAGGSGDWTSTEKAQIRYVLGLDGTTSTPTATPSGIFRSNLVQINGVTASGTGGAIYSDLRLVNGLPVSGVGTVSIDPTEIRSAVGLASANLDTQLADIPTVTEFNARTLPSGTYFDPATDTVATVTTLTNLPSITANWLTAAGLAADAVAEIQSGLSVLTSGNVQSIVSSGVTATQSTQASNAQTGAAAALTAYDPPTRTELTTDKNEIIASGITQAGVRAAVGLASANLDTQLADIPTVSEMNARTLPSGQYSTLAASDISSMLSSGVTVNVISSGAFQDIFETYALVEDYPTNGQPGTPAELLYLMKQAFTEFTITGSTITVKKLDGSTTAATYAMDSATSPTSRTRST